EGSGAGSAGSMSGVSGTVSPGDSGATSERRSSCGGGMASYSLYSSGWTGDASASGTGSCATAAHAHAQKSAAAAARLTPLLGRYVFMSLFRPGAVFLAYDLPDTDVQH